MLVKATTQKEPLPPDVFYEVLRCKSVDCDEALVRYINAISSEDRRSSIMAFLRGHYEQQSREENKRMTLRARSYEIRGDNLYKIGLPCEQTRRLTKCKVNMCKVCEYEPCEATEIPLRCFAQCEKAMASVVKRNCYGPIKWTRR
jgi:NADH:ubiquinone oxidoreductase subunit E